ncbi:origin recognition complex subunit 1 isoform X2 [Cryptotermes secundus]|nr:origin recognition complex subunit 1 isoform X2 [Cryptotermes secundus]
MKLTINRPKWIGEVVSYSHDSHMKKTFYNEFIFGSVQGKVGEFVLVSNADAVDPDTPEGCDVAEIIKLFETEDNEDPYRAIVRWYSRPHDVPKRTIRSLQLDKKLEVILDERPFDNDISIETFFSSCVVLGAKIDDDPVTEAKKLEGHVSVPVFVCRYKLVGSAYSAKIEPYLDVSENAVNKSSLKSAFRASSRDSSSGNNVAKQNKSNQPLSSKVDGIMKLCLKTSFPLDVDTEDNVLEANREKRRKECDREINELKSNLSPVKRSFRNDFAPPIESSHINHITTKASEALLGRTSYVLVKKLNLEEVIHKKNVEDGNRSISPPVPLTEPSMRWYGMKDDRNRLVTLKIPISACDSARKPLKSIGHENTQPSIKNTSLKDTEVLTLDTEDETESIDEFGRNVPVRYDEKKQMSNEKSGKSNKCRTLAEEEIFKTRSLTHKTKLKDKDISQLLDDDNSNDVIFIHKNVTDKPISDQNSHQKVCEASKNTILQGKKTFETNTTIVETKQMQTSNINKDEKKLKMKAVKDVSDKSNSESEDFGLVSSSASSSKTVLRKKQHPGQWSGNSEGCTRLKTVCERPVHIPLAASLLEDSVNTCVSASLSTPGSASLVAVRHVDDKVVKSSNSESCTGKSKYLYHTSVKKKLSYEDSGTNRKLPCGESQDRCIVTEARTVRQGKVTNRRAELSTPKVGCTGNSINGLEPIHKSKVIDNYLESMKNSKPLNRCQDHQQNNEDHWVSVPEDDNQGSASSCRSSLRLKICRTSRHTNHDIHQDTTPRRRKRHILSDSASDDSEYEPGSALRSKHYRAHEPSTRESLKVNEKASPCTRSSSRKRKPNTWYDSNWATPDSTPVSSLKKQVTNWTPVTSKTPKLEVTPQASTTPVPKKGSAQRALLTPSIPTRASPISTPGSVLEEARARLHVAAVPKSLPCREKEFNNIYHFVEGKILDGTGGCMYISGVPGTGKTATVQEVVRSLQEAVSQRNIPDFQFVELNGMWLTEPRQAYVQLLNALTGQTVTAEQAQQLLERRFSRTAHRRITTLLLVDELDLLWTRRQDVVYNLLDWPTKTSSCLVVLTIANTMDLPERLLMGRVTSRLGLTRVTFHPYTHKQLQEIVIARLKGLQAFDSDAIQLVARKVAAVSGDARRALDICRRATELAEGDTEDSDGTVTMQHVDQALGEMIASAKVQAIRYCSKMEQLFLQAVAAEIQRTGVEETIFENVYIQLKTLCVFDGHTVPSVTDSLGLCARLGSCRLLLTEHSRADVYQRILLNVSCDDIYYALKV